MFGLGPIAFVHELAASICVDKFNCLSLLLVILAVLWMINLWNMILILITKSLLLPIFNLIDLNGKGRNKKICQSIDYRENL